MQLIIGHLSVWTMGSECDGAFAQYMVAFSDETYKIESDWSDIELASIPCAYSTAENLTRALQMLKKVRSY